MRTITRYRGCLLGLATADAVGTTLEFSPPGSFRPITDLVGGGPFNLEPGQWTDDTSMALCLGQSLIEKRGFDPEDQMQRYVRWYSEGYFSSNGRCFDIGATVRGALNRFISNGEALAGSTDPRSAGNGSIMRLAPVPMFYGGNARDAIVYSGRSSLTTHGTQTAVDACRFLGAIIFGALNGADKVTLLSSLFTPVEGYWHEHPLAPEIDAIARGSYKSRQPPQIKGGGYVVHSLEAALWAFHHSRDFRHGCLLAANLGDDADTTAAVYGQIAGAFYGGTGIPDVWLEKLTMRAEITSMSEQLYYLARRRSE